MPNNEPVASAPVGDIKLGQMRLLSPVQTGLSGYGRYNVTTSTRTEKGLLQMPVAGASPAPARIVRVHAPYTIKTVNWIVERRCIAGDTPTLPHWDTGNDNETLLHQNIELDAPIIQANGGMFLWVARGEYIYALGAAATAFTSAGTPACVLPAQAFGLTEANFDKAFLSSVAVDPTTYADLLHDPYLDAGGGEFAQF